MGPDVFDTIEIVSKALLIEGELTEACIVGEPKVGAFRSVESVSGADFIETVGENEDRWRRSGKSWNLSGIILLLLLIIPEKSLGVICRSCLLSYLETSSPTSVETKVEMKYRSLSFGGEPSIEDEKIALGIEGEGDGVGEALGKNFEFTTIRNCLLYTSPSPRDRG